MLQTMTAQTDTKKYPTLSARVTKEYEKKFEDLLKFVQIEHPTLDKPTFVRMLLNCDTRIAIKNEWREYLSGLRDSPGELDQPSRPSIRPSRIRGVKQ
jgi:hypothetical protein